MKKILFSFLLVGCSHNQSWCFMFGCYKPVDNAKHNYKGPTCEAVQENNCAEDEAYICKKNSVGCQSCQCVKNQLE